MYGKIENGHLKVFHERKIVLGDKKIINPRREQLAILGYKPIITDTPPEVGDGQALVVDYIDEGEVIRARYTLQGGYKCQN